MGKCKNVECENETLNKRVYCSLKCRNYYVNKYLRNYTKVKDTFAKKKSLKVVEYLTNSVRCLECEAELDYEHKNHKFCNHSCAAKYNNKRKGKIKYSKKALENLRRVAGENWHKGKNTKIPIIRQEYEKTPNTCQNCNKVLSFDKRKNKCCNIKCSMELKSKIARQNKTEYQNYRIDCSFKFGLKQYPDEYDFSLIEKIGWYAPGNAKKPNLCGVSRDHIYSVKAGFENNINSYFISHPANCQLLIHNKNISKGKKINKFDFWNLINRIIKFEETYENETSINN